MKYETSIVYLEQLPKLVVESGPDYPTLIGFAVTIVIFGLGTWLSVHTSRKSSKLQTENLERTIEHQEGSIDKTIASQEAVAEKNSLKTSRQGWINDLRDTCAQFVSEALNVQRLNVSKKSLESNWGALKNGHPAEYASALSLWMSEHMQAKKEVRRLRARIDLLLNPTEQDSQFLMQWVKMIEIECDMELGRDVETDTLYQRVPKDLDDPCEELIKCCQKILKDEWEKAKEGV